VQPLQVLEVMDQVQRRIVQARVLARVQLQRIKPSLLQELVKVDQEVQPLHQVQILIQQVR